MCSSLFRQSVFMSSSSSVCLDTVCVHVQQFVCLFRHSLRSCPAVCLFVCLDTVCVHVQQFVCLDTVCVHVQKFVCLFVCLDTVCVHVQKFVCLFRHSLRSCPAVCLFVSLLNTPETDTVYPRIRSASAFFCVPQLHL